MRKLVLASHVLAAAAAVAALGALAFGISSQRPGQEGFAALAAVIGAVLMFAVAGALAGLSLLLARRAGLAPTPARAVGLGGLALVGLVASAFLVTVSFKNAVYGPVVVMGAGALLAGAGLAALTLDLRSGRVSRS